MNNYTDADIIDAAKSHVAYGWTKAPWGHWTPEQMRLYDDTYYAERQRVRGTPDPRKEQVAI